MSTVIGLARLSYVRTSSNRVPAVWFRARTGSGGRLQAFRPTFGRIAALPTRRPVMITHKRTILAQSVHASARRSARAPTAGQWLAVALFGISGAAAFSLVANTAPEMTPIRVIQLELRQPSVSVVNAEGVGYWREDRIRRGDTIGSVLARLGVDDPEALEFLRANPSARPLYQLRPGKPLAVETDDDGRLINLRFVTGDGERLSIARDGERLLRVARFVSLA